MNQSKNHSSRKQGCTGLAVALAVTALLASTWPASAQNAQGTGTTGGRRGGRGGFGRGAAGQGGFGQGGFGFGGGTFGRAQGGQSGMNDALQSNLLALVQRTDVREELHIGGAMAESLDNLVKSSAQAQQQMFQSLRQNRMRGQRGQNGGATGQDSTAAAQDPNSGQGGAAPADPNGAASAQGGQTSRQGRRAQMQQQMQTLQSDTESKIEAIIGAERMTRLRQLDLQWRGALALNDPKVATLLNLTTEQTGKVRAAYQTYVTSARSAMTPLFGGGRQGRGGRNAAGQANPPATDANSSNPTTNAAPTADEMAARRAEAQKTVAQARKTAETATVNALTPEQQSQWRQMQGRPFTFNKNI